MRSMRGGLGRTRWPLLAAATVVLLSSGFTAGALAQPMRVPASLVTDAGPANGVAIWVHPQEVARSAVLVAEGDAGVALYALDGGLVRRALVGGVVTDVDVAHAPPAALNASSLVLAVDAENRELLLYTVDPSTLALTPVPGSPIAADAGVRLGALHVSPDRAEASVIAAEATGSVRQWVLARDGGGPVSAELVRAFTVPPASGLGFQSIAVDDRFERLFLADGFQVIRASAAPDGGSSAFLVDAVGGYGGLLAPTDVALFTERDGRGYLLVADSAREAVTVYERGDLNQVLGSFQVLPNDGGQTALPLERVAVQAFGMGGAFDAGLLVTSGVAGTTPQTAFTGWGAVAGAFPTPLRTDPLSDPRGVTTDGGTVPDGGSGNQTPSPCPGCNPPSVPPPPAQVGCACSGAGGAGAVVGLAALLVGLARRRRT